MQPKVRTTDTICHQQPTNY